MSIMDFKSNTLYVSQAFYDRLMREFGKEKLPVNLAVVTPTHERLAFDHEVAIKVEDRLNREGPCTR